MKKIALFLTVILALVMITNTVIAQEPAPENPIYLPIVFYAKMDTTSPWVGPAGGPVVSMVTHPSNVNIVFAGSWGAGVFKSTDGGETWSPKNSGLNNLYINSMAIDPYNGNIVYAGTYGDKLYKTTNGGESWSQSSSGIQAGAIVYTITVDTVNADIVFIGTRGINTTGQPPWKGIVYRSTNEGINWTPVLQDVPRLGVNTQDWAYDLAVNPKNHNIVFAGMHEAGVYKSTNGGTSWAPANSGINTDIISVRGLSINPFGTSSDALYMGTWHRVGTYKSTNNAASWSNTPLDVKVYDMDLDEVSTNILYLANFDTNNYTGGIFKSTNSSSSWSLVGLGSESIYSVVVNQLSHNQVFAGTLTNGVYRSNDSGANWSAKSQGLFSTNTAGLIAINGSELELLGATNSNGVSLSTNRGVTWQPLNNGLGTKSMTGLTADPANPNHVFALSTSGGLYHCTLPSCSWSTVNSGLPTAAFPASVFGEGILDENQKLELSLAGMDPAPTIESKATNYKQLNQLVFAPSNSNVAYLATEGGGLLKSSDHAIHWSSAGLSGKIVKSVAVDPLNSNILYAATTDSGTIKYSSNGGSSWENQTFSGTLCNFLSISVVNPGQVYAATDNGVYTRIGTGNWLYLGLNGVAIKTIAAHPARVGVLVAGTASGYYYSMDNGQNWVQGSADVSNRSIRSILFDPNNMARVYLSTSTSGGYRFYLP